MTPGYLSLTGGAGLLDLSARGRIRVTGEDRARLLHAMTTNHVQQLKPGEGLYAFFLNAQGRIQADVYILCFDDHLLLDTEPETRQAVFEHLDRFIIADDATLEDVTDETFCLALEGPRALDVAQAASLPAPNHRYSHVDWGGFSVSAVSFTGAGAARIHGPIDRRDEAVQSLEAAGAIWASAQDGEMVRLQHFQPRFGADITEATLPQETQQLQALHFQKGCYLGQEIVERIRSRGHVNRQLMGFRMEWAEGDHGDIPGAGTKLFTGGKEAGEVTSAVLAPEGAVFGLAYVRVPYNKPGAVTGIEGRPAELFAPAGAA
ncbi:MAG: folate-binding protein [Acidobacteriota bacterium]|nr:folate-binding protein [Acidobacteriota bacterium]